MNNKIPINGILVSLLEQGLISQLHVVLNNNYCLNGNQVKQLHQHLEKIS
ncbi:MAG: hypothetical protein ABIN89_04650 [Chitinophagaceae bacterium]